MLLTMREQLARLLVTMNRLPIQKQAAIIRALTEGSSIRAAARMIGVSKDTVSKLLVEFGEFASIYQHHKLTDLRCDQLEIDEIWSFVGAKEQHAKQPGHGDIWTFTCIDATTKLMVSWLVGTRMPETARAFLQDVKDRLHPSVRPQLTTDGHGMYPDAVAAAFNWKTKGVDFAQLVKEYGRSPDFKQQEAHRRYSPAVCTKIEKSVVFGDPDPDNISTSYVERSNLSMRMGIRRFTRLTNAFSKKAQNHAHAVSVFYLIYNFCRPHGTLTKAARGIKTTPAMAAGLTGHVWSIESILEMMNPKRALQSN